MILHEGRIIQETYTGETDVRNPHILMSVSKSVLGLLAGILVEKGLFDLSAGVTSIIPE